MTPGGSVEKENLPEYRPSPGQRGPFALRGGGLIHNSSGMGGSVPCDAVFGRLFLYEANSTFLNDFRSNCCIVIFDAI